MFHSMRVSYTPLPVKGGKIRSMVLKTEAITDKKDFIKETEKKRGGEKKRKRNNMISQHNSLN